MAHLTANWRMRCAVVMLGPRCCEQRARQAAQGKGSHQHGCSYPLQGPSALEKWGVNAWSCEEQVGRPQAPDPA